MQHVNQILRIIIKNVKINKGKGEKGKENITSLEGEVMRVLFIITSDDAETVYNAMRLANVAVAKGDETSVFMLGKGVLFEQISNEQFDVMELVNKFEGDFYV